jgi:hypothetical protein
MIAHDLCSHMEVTWPACHLDGICLSRMTPCLARPADFRLPRPEVETLGGSSLLSLIGCKLVRAQLCQRRQQSFAHYLSCSTHIYSDHAGQTLQSVWVRNILLRFCFFGPSVRGVRICLPQSFGDWRAITISTRPKNADAICHREHSMWLSISIIRGSNAIHHLRASFNLDRKASDPVSLLFRSRQALSQPSRLATRKLEWT